jgi:hypothetical protein
MVKLFFEDEYKERVLEEKKIELTKELKNIVSDEIRREIFSSILDTSMHDFTDTAERQRVIETLTTSDSQASATSNRTTTQPVVNQQTVTNQPPVTNQQPITHPQGLISEIVNMLKLPSDIIKDIKNPFMIISLISKLTLFNISLLLGAMFIYDNYNVFIILSLLTSIIGYVIYYVIGVIIISDIHRQGAHQQMAPSQGAQNTMSPGPLYLGDTFQPNNNPIISTQFGGYLSLIRNLLGHNIPPAQQNIPQILMNGSGDRINMNFSRNMLNNLHLISESR